MSIMVKGVLRSKTGAPVQRIVLDVSPGLTFRPGQYVEVVHPDGFTVWFYDRNPNAADD